MDDLDAVWIIGTNHFGNKTRESLKSEISGALCERSLVFAAPDCELEGEEVRGVYYCDRYLTGRFWGESYPGTPGGLYKVYKANSDLNRADLSETLIV